MHLLAAMAPYPSWLNPGDNAWQLVAATLVGLMSLPGIAVLYGGLRAAQVGREHDAHGVQRLRRGAASSGCCGATTWPSGRSRTSGRPGRSSRGSSASSGRWRATSASRTRRSPGRCPRGLRVPLPDVDVRLLPGRLRRDHAAAVPGRGRRAGSSSRRGSCSCRCGSPSSTASTPRCSGAAAASPRRARSTTRAATSSTSPRA